jgi:hypothetical protein
VNRNRATMQNGYKVSFHTDERVKERMAKAMQEAEAVKKD